MIDENRLVEIEEREKNATPGPWVNSRHLIMIGNELIAESYYKPDDYNMDLKNSAFIAHSRADIPWLVDLVKELRAEVVRLNQVVREGRG